MSAITTAAPSAASLRQCAAPIWRAPPVTMATFPASLTTTPWSDGVLDYWSVGVVTHHCATLVLEYSNASRQSPQMLAKIHWFPPGFDTEGFRDHLRRIVARRAGDVSARMA